VSKLQSDISDLPLPVCQNESSCGNYSYQNENVCYSHVDFRANRNSLLNEDSFSNRGTSSLGIRAQSELFKKNSRHFFIQSEAKAKPIATRSNSLSRASHQLHVFTPGFNWFLGFASKTLHWKPLLSILRPTVGINPSLLVVHLGFRRIDIDIS